MTARDRDTALVRRGDIFYADLSPVVGSEQRGIRPVLVVQNDVANRLSPTVVVCALTSRLKKPSLPTHVLVRTHEERGGSVALLEQLRTLDKRRLLRRIGRADALTMRRVDRALAYALGMEGLLETGTVAGTGPGLEGRADRASLAYREARDDEGADKEDPTAVPRAGVPVTDRRTVRRSRT